ncbi:MAG: hypothetical protein DCF22_22375 [Leptolyngbya sp.]|nr:MAG: hypothetical protein DCF22_22375 [Leptolyngbya sp.]
MNYREAFDKTLKTFGITAKSLSEATGVQERQISLFRKGKDLMAGNFFLLVEALPEPARQHFFEQLGGQPSDLASIQFEGNQPSDPSSVVNSMNSTELVQLLGAISDKLKQGSGVPQELIQV